MNSNNPDVMVVEVCCAVSGDSGRKQPKIDAIVLTETSIEKSQRRCFLHCAEMFLKMIFLFIQLPPKQFLSYLTSPQRIRKAYCVNSTHSLPNEPSHIKLNMP